MRQKLKDSIQSRLASCSGNTGFYYKNLDTLYSFGVNEHEAFLAASVIKLPVCAEIYRQAALGKVDLDEKIIVSDCDKLPSCGALNSFTGDVEADIRTLCNLMITLSDNTATNVLLRRFGIAALNRGFQESGIHRSRICRLLFDGEAAAQGKENVIVLSEIGSLLEQIARRTFADSQTSEKIESILLKQQINHKICGKLTEDIPVAHKTGEDDGITNDVGIVYAKHPFMVCFASNETDVPVFEQHIRDISYELYLDANQ